MANTNQTSLTSEMKSFQITDCRLDLLVQIISSAWMSIQIQTLTQSLNQILTLY